MPDTNPAPAPSSTTETRARTTKPASSEQAPVRQRTETARAAHFILQGKGGVGKSLVANLLAQYLADQKRLESCFDTDPVNGSLQTIPALKAQPVALLAGDALNVQAVDRLVEAIVTAKTDVVVDNGAASFLPFSRYLIENDIAAVLAEHAATMVLHTVVTGGGNGMDTIKGLDALVRHFVPGASMVVWVNEFFGAARFDGTDFEDTNIYREHRANIRGLIYLRKLDPVMFAPNLASMLERRMTFAEAAVSGEYMLMEKSRLFRIKTDIWNQLAAVL
jgi:DNA polymerase III delta prime subunit